MRRLCNLFKKIEHRKLKYRKTISEIKTLCARAVNLFVIYTVKNQA